MPYRRRSSEQIATFISWTRRQLNRCDVSIFSAETNSTHPDWITTVILITAQWPELLASHHALGAAVVLLSEIRVRELHDLGEVAFDASQIVAARLLGNLTLGSEHDGVSSE